MEEVEEEERALVHQVQGHPDQSHPEPQDQILDLPFLLSPPGTPSHDLHRVAGVSVQTPTVMSLCVTVVRMPSS